MIILFCRKIDIICLFVWSWTLYSVVNMFCSFDRDKVTEPVFQRRSNHWELPSSYFEEKLFYYGKCNRWYDAALAIRQCVEAGDWKLFAGMTQHLGMEAEVGQGLVLYNIQEMSGYVIISCSCLIFCPRSCTLLRRAVPWWRWWHVPDVTCLALSWTRCWITRVTPDGT